MLDCRSYLNRPKFNQWSACEKDRQLTSSGHADVGDVSQLERLERRHELVAVADDDGQQARGIDVLRGDRGDVVFARATRTLGTKVVK